MALWSLRGQHWTPAADVALLDLRLRDVGTANTPLLGPFSRYGWSHPGPLMFWLLAPVFRLLGASPVAALAAVGVQNIAVVVGIGLSARRIGGRRFGLATSLVLALFVGSLGGQLLLNTWNPWIALLPFALFLLTAWGLAEGGRWWAPAVVLLGSYLVQTHVGYLPLVAAIAAVAVALAVHAHRTGGREAPTARAAAPARRDGVRVALACVVVGLACWAGPLVDQLTQDPGNLRAIATYFTGDTEHEPTGFAEAGTQLGRQFSLWAPWMGASEDIDFLATVGDTSLWNAVPVALLAIAGVAAALRFGDRTSLRLQAIVATGVAAGVVATSRVTGDPYYYLLRWWWVLAAFTWLAALRPFLVLELPGTVRRWVGVALVGAAVVVAVVGATGATDPVPRSVHDDAVEALAPPLLAELDRRDPGRDQAWLLRTSGYSWFEVRAGLLDLLDREGVDVLVDPHLESHGGSDRVVGDRPVAGVVTVVSGEEALADVRRDPAAHEVAVFDPLEPDERDELRRLQAEVADDLRAAGREDLVPAVDSGAVNYLPTITDAADPDATARIEELLRRGPVESVFLLPPPPPGW